MGQPGQPFFFGKAFLPAGGPIGERALYFLFFLTRSFTRLCHQNVVRRLGGHDGDSLLTGSEKYQASACTKQDPGTARHQL